MITRYKLLLFVAMVINYTAILTSIAIWRNNIIAYLIAILASLSTGLVTKRIEDLIVSMVLAYVIAAITTVFMVISPALFLRGWGAQIEIGFLGISGTIIYNSFFIVPFSILSALFGSFISDSLSRNRKDLSLR